MSNRYTVSDLLGNDSSFTNMSKDEKKYFIEIIKEEMARRAESTKYEQIRPLVPIEEWVNSTYYVGQDANSIYPYWKDFIIDIFRDSRHSDEKINQVILSGSIGTGKSTCAELIMLRKLYELSCFRNINAMFHLMSKTNIMFLYFSVNQKQAERTGFGEFRAFVDNSPYFKENFKRKANLDSLLVFPEGLMYAYGSNSSDSIGMSVICSMLDEANFVAGNGNNTSGNTEKAMELYAGIINRANSRFILEGGVNHSLNILVSSSTHENSATERQIALSKDDKHTIIAAPSQWEVKPDKFSKKYFYVMKGTDYMEPSIVRSTDDVNSFRLSEGLQKDKYVDGLEDYNDIDKEIKKLPPHLQDKFLRVPIDLKAGFEANLIRSLQDLGGVSTGTQGKLFNSPTVFNDCIDSELHHPFISNEIVISTGDNLEIKDYLREDFRLKDRDKPRFIHIDQSYRTDSTGISCVYVSDLMKDDTTGSLKPIFSTDFMLRINPPKPPRKIAIYKIRDFVVFLARVVGMNIGKITYDIFNSEESRQILEEMGFNVGYQSVDRTDKAYLDLVEIMYEGRLKFYDYPILRHELFNLIHDRARRKVDHPVSTTDSYNGKGAGVGSKDVSDSLCLFYNTKVLILDKGLYHNNIAYKTIEDLYNDYTKGIYHYVLSYDIQLNTFIFNRIVNVIQKEKIPYYLTRIYYKDIKNNTIVSDIMTPNHKVLVYDRNNDIYDYYDRDSDRNNDIYDYKEACNLNIGDTIAFYNPINNSIKRSYIVDIERDYINQDSHRIYDIQLNNIHNFILSNGMIVHNCGALENALQFKITDEAGYNHTYRDFINANRFRGDGILEPSARNADEMIDRMLDDAIEEKEIYGDIDEHPIIGIRRY